MSLILNNKGNYNIIPRATDDIASVKNGELVTIDSSDIQLQLLKGQPIENTTNEFHMCKISGENTIMTQFKSLDNGFVKLYVRVKDKFDVNTSLSNYIFSPLGLVDISVHSEDRSVLLYHITTSVTGVFEIPVVNNFLITVQISQINKIKDYMEDEPYVSKEPSIVVGYEKISKRVNYEDKQILLKTDGIIPREYDNMIAFQANEMYSKSIKSLHPKYFTSSVNGAKFSDYMTGNSSYLGWVHDITQNENIKIGFKNVEKNTELKELINKCVMNILCYSQCVDDNSLIKYRYRIVSNGIAGIWSDEITTQNGQSANSVIMNYTGEDYESDYIEIEIIECNNGDFLRIDPSTSDITQLVQYVDNKFKQLAYLEELQKIESKTTDKINGLKSSLEKTKVQVEAKAENTRVDSLENNLNNLSICNNLTLQVGQGGDFSTINEALKFLSIKRKLYGKNGIIKASIILKTGFIMKEQVLLDGNDLSWIEISSEDEEVLVDRASLSTLFSIDDGMSAYPLFGAKKNSSLPMINVLFNMNETGSASNRHGFFIADNSSVYIRPSKGCKNAGGMGINVINGSRALVFGGVFDGAKNHGCSCFRGSYLNIRMGSAKNCGACGIYFGSSSKVVALGADFSSAVEHGVWCYNLGQIDIRDGKVDNCGKYGIYAMHGTIISAGGISDTNCYLGGVLAEDGAFVELHGANISGSTGGSGIVANTGARINATGATINNNKNDGATLTSSYGNFANAIIEGNGRGGIWANRGSEVTADSCNATNGTDKAFKVTHSSVIKCPNSAGEFSIAQNTITTAGLIMSNRA